MAAFRAAIDAGADAIEFDVHQTRDHHLVVIHDYDLARTTNGDGLVHHRDAGYISTLDAGSWFGSEFAGEGVPELSAVLSLEGIEFELELKGFSEGFLERVVEAVAERDLLSKVEFTSPHLALLFRLRQSFPKVRIGLFAIPSDVPLAQQLLAALGE